MDAQGRVSQADYHAALDRRNKHEDALRSRIAELEAALDKIEMMIRENDHPHAVVRYVRKTLGKPVNL